MYRQNCFVVKVCPMHSDMNDTLCRNFRAFKSLMRPDFAFFLFWSAFVFDDYIYNTCLFLILFFLLYNLDHPTF